MARLSRMVATQRVGPVDPFAFAPSYNLTVNAGAGNAREIAAAVRRELAASTARMKQCGSHEGRGAGIPQSLMF